MGPIELPARLAAWSSFVDVGLCEVDCDGSCTDELFFGQMASARNSRWSDWGDPGPVSSA